MKKYYILFLIIIFFFISCIKIQRPEGLPECYKTGKYGGYYYSSEIDPGIIISECDLLNSDDDGMGGTLSIYKNLNDSEPKIILFFISPYGQVQVYAYKINNKEYYYESYQDGFIFYYREIKWDDYMMPFKGMIDEILNEKEK